MWCTIVLVLVACVAVVANEECSCSSKCRPSISVTTDGSGRGMGGRGRGGRGRGGDDDDDDNEMMLVSDIPDWWYPYGNRPGAPSYMFRFPSTPVGSGGSWYDADRYCRAFGGFSNLLWIASKEEFALVRKWVTSKFSPAADNLRIWTGGQKTFAVPVWLYRWNYTSVVIDNSFWASGQPNDLTCVGMNPYKQNYLQGYNCHEITTVSPQTQYSGLVCKRQVVAPPP